MVNPPARKFASYSKATQDRIAKQAELEWGLSRRQVREMYDRGSYRPLAKNPEDRIPRSFRVGRKQDERKVVARFDNLFRDTFSWENGGRERFRSDVEDVPRSGLRYILEADEDEILDMAAYQEDDAPDWLLDMGWYDDEGKWHNPFWYH